MSTAMTAAPIMDQSTSPPCSRRRLPARTRPRTVHGLESAAKRRGIANFACPPAALPVHNPALPNGPDKTVTTKATPEPAAPRRRNPELTRASLLKAATREFARHGFDAARTERIVKAAGCNPRMLYHYFGSKQRLYIAVLEDVYQAIRAREQALDLTAAEPRAGLLRLTRFTWAHFLAERVFIDITRYENLARGKYIRQSKAIAEMSSPLIAQLHDVLQRGRAAGAFSHQVDPLQLYVSIVALSVHHLNNAHTLGATFATDLLDPVWLSERKAHVETMVLRMVGAAPLDGAAGPP